MFITLFVLIVFAVPLLIAAYTDFSTMKISNKVSLAMAAGFFLTLPLHWQGLPVLGDHLLVGAFFLVAGFAMFAFGWLGGGDAKLMAAIGLWLGWPDMLPFILYTTLFGAALGVFLMLGSQFMPIRLRTSSVGMRLFQGGSDMPYGLALAAGALFIWPSSQINAALIG